MFLKHFAKFTKKKSMRRLFFNRVAGCRLKKDSGAGAFCKFCVISKNDYLVEHVQTVAFDIFGYPYVGPARSILRKSTVFSSILALIYFKLILESCTTSKMYSEQYQTSMMRRFPKNI